MKKGAWKLVKVWMKKPQGDVWVVRSSTGKRHFFKTTERKNPYYAGTMVANEFIAAALANKLGFPVGRLVLAKVKGPDGVWRKGIISKEVGAREVITWNSAKAAVKRTPEKYIKNLQKLKALVVFDAWIVNIDRGKGNNIILYRNHPKAKYDWYLIDHANTLYGSRYKWKRRGVWNRTFWQKLWKYYHVPKGMLRLQSSPQSINPMIRKIASLTAQDIDKAIGRVPRSHLKKRSARFIRKLLITRQRQLPAILRRWRAYKGRKE